MAPVVGEVAAGDGETRSAAVSTGTGFGPDLLSGGGVSSSASSIPKSSPLCPRSSPWKSSSAAPAGGAASGSSGDGPQGMVLVGPGASAKLDGGRTKKREVLPIPSEGGAFHHSSGIDAAGWGSSWNSRGSGTEKRSVRVMGTSRSS